MFSINVELVAVGLTYRFAPLNRSAEILLLDISTGKVLQRRWLPPPRFDLTPGDRPTGGGRQRGARGVCCLDGVIHVATFDSIFSLDRDLRLLDQVTSDRFCDIHEFSVSKAGFVVTSTRMDAVVWCDPSGALERIWCATEDESLLSADIGIPKIVRDRDCDWRACYPNENPTHVNAVSFNGSATLAALHNQGVLWDIDGKSIFHDARTADAGKTHNHIRLGDGRVVVNDTAHGRLVQWEGANQVSIDLSEPGICPKRPDGLSAPWAIEHGWLRGLAETRDGRFLAGQCPAAIIVVGRNLDRIEKIVRLHDDWRVSVNGIAVLDWNG